MDTVEHSHREAEGNIQTNTNHLADVLSRQTATDTRVRQNEDKIKADEQTVRDIAARISLLPTSEDLASVRRDLNDKVCFFCFVLRRLLFACLLCYAMYQIRNDLQKGLQQHEENTTQTLIKHEQRVNNLRVDLNILEEQINQRMAHVSFNKNNY